MWRWMMEGELSYKVTQPTCTVNQIDTGVLSFAIRSKPSYEHLGGFLALSKQTNLCATSRICYLVSCSHCSKYVSSRILSFAYKCHYWPSSINLVVPCLYKPMETMKQSSNIYKTKLWTLWTIHATDSIQLTSTLFESIGQSGSRSR